MSASMGGTLAPAVGTSAGQMGGRRLLRVSPLLFLRSQQAVDWPAWHTRSLQLRELFHLQLEDAQTEIPCTCSILVKAETRLQAHAVGIKLFS